MPKLNEKGAVFVILVFVFISVSIIAGTLVYKTFSARYKKLSDNADVLAVELKREYNNPFDKNTQYVNPFSEYKNPMDELK